MEDRACCGLQCQQTVLMVVVGASGWNPTVVDVTEGTANNALHHEAMNTT